MFIDINACLILENGMRFFGCGIGVEGVVAGEICFNTAMTGYQEVITDPSHSGQIVTFAFPHIGNVGVNDEDMESSRPHLSGIVFKDFITPPSNYRSQKSLSDWLCQNKVIGISQIDTRYLIQVIRGKSPLKALIYHGKNFPDEEKVIGLKHQLGHEKDTLDKEFYRTIHQLRENFVAQNKQDQIKIVVLDFGVKSQTLRCLESLGCTVVLLPPLSPYETIMKENPKGVLYSSGPGDPRPISCHTSFTIQKLLQNKVPFFGICLGHQLLGLALGGVIEKMPTGHHGINHPVKDIESGKVEITSQNHDFILRQNSLPDTCQKTHYSLFDGTLQGIEMTNGPAFSVQFHPEASPGPQDSRWLFNKFINRVHQYAKKN